MPRTLVVPCPVLNRTHFSKWLRHYPSQQQSVRGELLGASLHEVRLESPLQASEACAGVKSPRNLTVT